MPKPTLASAHDQVIEGLRKQNLASLLARDWLTHVLLSGADAKKRNKVLIKTLSTAISKYRDELNRFIEKMGVTETPVRKLLDSQKLTLEAILKNIGALPENSPTPKDTWEKCFRLLDTWDQIDESTKYMLEVLKSDDSSFRTFQEFNHLALSVFTASLWQNTVEEYNLQSTVHGLVDKLVNAIKPPENAHALTELVEHDTLTEISEELLRKATGFFGDGKTMKKWVKQVADEVLPSFLGIHMDEREELRTLKIRISGLIAVEESQGFELKADDFDGYLDACYRTPQKRNDETDAEKEQRHKRAAEKTRVKKEIARYIDYARKIRNERMDHLVINIPEEATNLRRSQLIDVIAKAQLIRDDEIRKGQIFTQEELEVISPFLSEVATKISADLQRNIEKSKELKEHLIVQDLGIIAEEFNKKLKDLFIMDALKRLNAAVDTDTHRIDFYTRLIAATRKKLQEENKKIIEYIDANNEWAQSLLTLSYDMSSQVIVGDRNNLLIRVLNTTPFGLTREMPVALSAKLQGLYNIEEVVPRLKNIYAHGNNIISAPNIDENKSVQAAYKRLEDTIKKLEEHHKQLERNILTVTLIEIKKRIQVQLAAHKEETKQKYGKISSKLKTSLDEEDKTRASAILSKIRELEGCGIVKVDTKPCKFEDITALLGDIDGILLFGDELFYANQVTRKVEQISLDEATDEIRENYKSLKLKFKDAYQLADTDSLKWLSSLTKHTKSDIVSEKKWINELLTLDVPEGFDFSEIHDDLRRLNDYYDENSAKKQLALRIQAPVLMPEEELFAKKLRKYINILINFKNSLFKLISVFSGFINVISWIPAQIFKFFNTSRSIYKEFAKERAELRDEIYSFMKTHQDSLDQDTELHEEVMKISERLKQLDDEAGRFSSDFLKLRYDEKNSFEDILNRFSIVKSHLAINLKDPSSKSEREEELPESLAAYTPILNNTSSPFNSSDTLESPLGSRSPGQVENRVDYYASLPESEVLDTVTQDCYKSFIKHLNNLVENSDQNDYLKAKKSELMSLTTSLFDINIIKLRDLSTKIDTRFERIVTTIRAELEKYKELGRVITKEDILSLDGQLATFDALKLEIDTEVREYITPPTLAQKVLKQLLRETAIMHANPSARQIIAQGIAAAADELKQSHGGFLEVLQAMGTIASTAITQNGGVKKTVLDALESLSTENGGYVSTFVDIFQAIDTETLTTDDPTLPAFLTHILANQDIATALNRGMAEFIFGIRENRTISSSMHTATITLLENLAETQGGYHNALSLLHRAEAAAPGESAFPDILVELMHIPECAQAINLGMQTAVRASKEGENFSKTITKGLSIAISDLYRQNKRIALSLLQRMANEVGILNLGGLSLGFGTMAVTTATGAALSITGSATKAALSTTGAATRVVTSNVRAAYGSICGFFHHRTQEEEPKIAAESNQDPSVEFGI